MARKTVLLDDLESSEVDADAGTVHFALEGQEYEIDLSVKNATKLRSVLQPFITAARRPSTPQRKKTNSHASVASEQLQAIREWARRNGHQVSDKGRIPGEIMHAFEAQQHGPTQDHKPGRARKAAAKQVANDPEFSAAV